MRQTSSTLLRQRSIGSRWRKTARGRRMAEWLGTTASSTGGRRPIRKQAVTLCQRFSNWLAALGNRNSANVPGALGSGDIVVG